MAQLCTSVLTGVGLLNLSAVGMGDKLCSVAYSEDWHLADKLAKIDFECLWVVNAVRGAAKDNANDGLVGYRELVVRENLTKGVEFTNATSYELRCL